MSENEDKILARVDSSEITFEVWGILANQGVKWGILCDVMGLPPDGPDTLGTLLDLLKDARPR